MKQNKQPDTSFDKLVLICSIVYPATALPQIIKVFSSHSAHDLSLLSWVLYALLESIFLAYAINKRLVPIIIQDSLWLVVYIVLIMAILLYGK